MKKILISIFLLFVLICTGSTFSVLASDLPYDGDLFLDGFPVDGKVTGNSDVNVYDLQNHELVVVDTLEPETVVTLRAILVRPDGIQYYDVVYTKDDISCTGYVEFYSIEPIDAEITPAPEVDLDSINLNKNWIQSFTDFISGFRNFLTSLGNLLHVVFPFFTRTEINFVITFLLIFFGLLVYLLVRKVTV